MTAEAQTGSTKSRHGGRRPGSGQKPSTIEGILARLPDKHKKPFLRSVQRAVAKTVKSILRGEKLDGEKPPSLVSKARQVDVAAQGRAGKCAPTTDGRHGGRRIPGPGKKLGRPPFTVTGIYTSYPQRAERLRLDIKRLAAEEVARRLGVTIANTRQVRAKHKTPGVASTDRPSRRGGRRVPGPGTKLGRPTGTHNPRNLPLYMRTLRTKLGITELGDMRVHVPITELRELIESSGKPPNKPGPHADNTLNAEIERLYEAKKGDKPELGKGGWLEIKQYLDVKTGTNLSIDAYQMRLKRYRSRRATH